MECSDDRCPEHLIKFLADHLSPDAVDPHLVFDGIDWHDERAVEVAIFHAYRNYADQSWASTVAEQWIRSMSQESMSA